jgi:hypothetical protein
VLEHALQQQEKLLRHGLRVVGDGRGRRRGRGLGVGWGEGEDSQGEYGKR